MKRGFWAAVVCVGSLAIVLLYMGAMLHMTPIVELFHSSFDKRPCHQPFSAWMSEDGKIRFEVDENGDGCGTLETEEGTVEICFSVDRYLGDRIEIGRVDEEGNVTLVENWNGNFQQENEFTATVDKRTTYFEIGQTVRFVRVSEGESVQASRKDAEER